MYAYMTQSRQSKMTTGMHTKSHGSEIHDLQPRKAPKPYAFIEAPLALTVPEVSILLDEPIRIPPINSFESPKLQRDIASHSFKKSTCTQYSPTLNQAKPLKDESQAADISSRGEGIRSCNGFSLAPQYQSPNNQSVKNDAPLPTSIKFDEMPNSAHYHLQGQGMYHLSSEYSSLNHNKSEPKLDYKEEQQCAEKGKVDPPHSACTKQRSVPGSSHSSHAKDKKSFCSVQFEKLYSIIKLQNEQIQILRFDFENMKRSCKVEEKIDGLHKKLSQLIDCNEKLSKCHKTSHQATQTLPSADPQQVSVGVMTSLSFPHNSPETSEPCLQCNKICKATNLVSTLSLPRLEHVRLEEQDQGSVCSLHLDVQDFSCRSESSCSDVTSDTSSDDEASDEESSQSNEAAANQQGQREGWTFYDNALGQINHMLHMPSQAGNPAVKLPRAFDHEQVQQHRVKLAAKENETLPKRVMFDSSLSAHHEQVFGREGMENVSAHMNAMALKHLTDQQLSNLAVNAAVSRPGEMAAMARFSDMTVYNNNLSFATMHYMQRYHILPSGSPVLQPTAAPLPTVMEQKKQAQSNPMKFLPRARPQHKKKKKKQRETAADNPAAVQLSSGTSKILDITALKQQPKLL